MEPDTEDINRSGSLDSRNDYFEYKIELDKYSEYQVETYENEAGWKYYRIPLGEFTTQVGSPDFARIEYARVWAENIPANSGISIFRIDMIGNDWKPLGIAENDTASFGLTLTKNDEILSVSVVNTEDDYPKYKSPPGVEGLQDRITKVMAKEQSLSMKVENLPPGQTAFSQKTFYDEFNLIHYQYLKLFIHGDENLFEDDSDAEFIMRIGKDDNNYYEFREPVYQGWDSRNEVIIPLSELSNTKLSEEIDDFGYRTKTLEGGKIFRVVGFPTLRQVNRITFGLKNKSTYKYLNTELWLDEVRLSDVEQVKGIAYRASGSIQLADLANINGNIQKTEADFHSINDRFGTAMNTSSRSLTASFDINRLYSAKKIFDIPVTIGYNNTRSVPKYLTGSDILLPTEIPESDSLRKLYEREISERVDKRMSIGFKKVMPSQNWILQNTIDKLSFNFSTTSSSMHDFNTELNETSTKQFALNYGLTFPDKFVKPLFFMKSLPLIGNKLGNLEFHYIPGNLTFSGTANQSDAMSIIRGSTPKPSKTFSVNRSIGTSLTPFNNLSFEVSRIYSNDLRDFNTGDIFKGILMSDSTEVSMNQKFSSNFNPVFFEWLKNSFTYSSTYQLNNNLQYKTTGKAVTLSKNIAGDFSFSITNMLKSFGLNLGPSASGSGGQPQPPEQQRRRSEEGVEKDQEDTGKKSGLRFSLDDIKDFVNKIQDIKINIARTLTSNEVGLSDKPGLDYMLGFKPSTGIPILETAGNQQGSSQETYKISFGTGFSLTKYINVSLNYAKNISESSNGTSKSGTESESVGAFGDKPSAFPNWGIRMNNLEKFFLFKPLFKSLSITSNYTGQKTVTKEGEDFTPTIMAISKSYSPLMQAQVTLFFGLKVTFNLSRTEKLTDNLKVNQASKDVSNSMQISTGFQTSGGFTIPIPLLGKKRFENNINASIAYQRTTTIGSKKKQNGEWTIDQETRDWSFKPNITYSFSSKINGSIQFDIGKNYNKLSGERKRVEGSISVNIIIAG
jgi:cell surface protein SprA